MKLKYLYILAVLAAMLIQSCEEGYKTYDGIYISGTLDNNPVIMIKVAADFPKETPLVVASTDVVDEDVMVELQVDKDKVKEYNAKWGTNYNFLPQENIVLSHPTVVIERGNFATTTPVSLNIIGINGTTDGEKYMIPVTLTKVSKGKVIEASRTVYVVLDQVLVTSALDLGASGYLTVNFWEGTDEAKAKYNTKALPAVTYEMRVFINSYNSLFNTIMGLEENLVLRVNSENNNGNKLDAAGGGMGNVMNTTAFPIGVWTHVAMTYDSNSMLVVLYINGEQVASRQVTRNSELKMVNLCAAYEFSKWDYNTTPFFIGLSAGERGGRYLNGKASEARIWAKALTQSEIANNMCYVNPASDGLLAYWRFNDNDPSVTQFEDITGHGFTATLKNLSSSKWVQKIRCPE